MGILFHSDGVDYNLPNSEKTKSWLEKCISLQNKKCGDINIVFCNDDYLLNINKTYLKHDYYTDIITFDYSQKQKISGDLFISITRIVDNAKKLNIDFLDELYRVIVHGVLHLCGFNDKTKEEIEIIRAKENEMLLLIY